MDSLLLEQRRILQTASEQAGYVDHILGKHAEGAPRSAKTAYAAFLSALSAAMHTDIAGEELQGVAFDVFTSLQHDGFSADPSGLSQLLGTSVTRAELHDLQQAHSALAAERQRLKLPPEPQPASEKTPWKPRYFEPTNERLPFDAAAVLTKLCALPEPAEAPTVTPEGAPTPAALAQAYAQQLQNAQRDLPSTFELVAPEPPKPLASSSNLHGDLDRARGKMSLTNLEQMVCKITGQSPPSRGGDDTVLLLIVQTLLQNADPDAAAGHLLEVLGFDRMDPISDIVNHREVCRRQLCLHAVWLSFRPLEPTAVLATAMALPPEEYPEAQRSVCTCSGIAQRRGRGLWR